MDPIRLLSAAEQVAEHLRSEIFKRNLVGQMPGIQQLVTGLAVNHKTVRAALEIMEKEGVIENRGAGRPRTIPGSESRANPLRPLIIGTLLHEPADRSIEYHIELQQQLRKAGFEPFFAAKTLTELRMDVRRVADFTKSVDADAWVVVAGSRPVLDWFAEQPFPVFGLFGRIVHTSLAGTGPKKTTAIVASLRHLRDLGHTRIVMLAREARRMPQPGFVEQVFLDELAASGAPTGIYNLPNWQESRQGFQNILDSLFQHTPPTALFCQGTELTVAALQYFSRVGIEAPRDVSLIAMDPDQAYTMCNPVVSHIAYDSKPWIGRIVRWAQNVAKGKEDYRKVSFPAKFVEGGTIGPAKE